MVTLNRRNVLIGMGTIVAGGGAALGTGAFSSVEAERSVDINTDADADALVGLELDDSIDGGGDTIAIEIGADDDAGVNYDAVTTFEAALTITNNREDGDIDVDIEDDDDTSIVDGGQPLRFESLDDTDGIEPGDDVSFDVVIDLDEGDEGDLPEDIWIVATESED